MTNIIDLYWRPDRGILNFMETAPYQRPTAELDTRPVNESRGRCPTAKHDRHRGWLIEENWLHEWEATHPDFDPTPLHLYDGPSDNRYMRGKTRDDVIAEIDEWIDENDPLPTPERAS